MLETAGGTVGEGGDSYLITNKMTGTEESTTAVSALCRVQSSLELLSYTAALKNDMEELHGGSFPVGLDLDSLARVTPAEHTSVSGDNSAPSSPVIQHPSPSHSPPLYDHEEMKMSRLVPTPSQAENSPPRLAVSVSQHTARSCTHRPEPGQPGATHQSRFGAPAPAPLLPSGFSSSLLPLTSASSHETAIRMLHRNFTESQKQELLSAVFMPPHSSTLLVQQAEGRPEVARQENGGDHKMERNVKASKETLAAGSTSVFQDPFSTGKEGLVLPTSAPLLPSWQLLPRSSGSEPPGTTVSEVVGTHPAEKAAFSLISNPLAAGFLPVWLPPTSSSLISATAGQGPSVMSTAQLPFPAPGSHTESDFKNAGEQECRDDHVDWKRENEGLRLQIKVKDDTIVDLQKKVKQLEDRIEELRQLPTGKISQIPVADMLEIMREYGSETSETAMPPRKSSIQKASVVRQFRRWNPHFFEYFAYKGGKWVPKLGKEGELQRRALARRLTAQHRNQGQIKSSRSSPASANQTDDESSMSLAP